MKSIILTISVLFLFVTGKAQKNYSALLQSYLDAQEKINGFGGAVLIAKKGDILLVDAFGPANREWKIPNTKQTKFGIGSLTKQFTAAAILQLQERGKLNVEEKLSKYFADFPKGDTVTLHMLLNHTSGIKNYTNIPRFATLSPLHYPKDSVIALFKNESYEFSPGTKYNYSNSGYFLLGYIIEKVTNQSYGDYILNNIIKKAGLENTVVNRLDSILPNRAAGYTKTQTGWRNAEYISMEFPYSAGSMISTVGDLYKWNTALFSGKVISPHMFARMTTQYLHKYGYGLIVDSLYNERLIGHSGSIPGFLSYNFIFPDDDIHVIILSNSDSDLEAVSSALTGILFDREVINPYKHIEIKVDVSDLEKFIGKYQTDIGGFELVIKDDKLYRRTRGGDIELKAESQNKFFFSDGSDRQLNFVINGQSIIEVQIIRNGILQVIKKIK